VHISIALTVLHDHQVYGWSKLYCLIKY